ncbi:YhjD/YihY/BrkB family envelope integrity protein, partial [Streptomyces sp. NPDC058621]|uniref:YhjD/YihY/BrkB family envelope integrity protein n=1 Tax=Streptomyces sp. NPDC058621 TaxID=3346561 RepID=UPI00364A4AD3
MTHIAKADRDGGHARPDTGRDDQAGPDRDVEERAPDQPSGLPARSWLAVLRGTVKEFTNDELADRAAALTYYGVLALFPALLVLVSLLGMAGESATKQVGSSRSSPPSWSSCPCWAWR